MLTQPIKDKLIQLFDETPEDVGVSFGNKMKNNQLTDERSIIFMVREKKPIDQLKPEEIFPSEIIIDGNIIKTDVVQISEIKTMCDSTTLGQCYNWSPVGVGTPANRNLIRPLQGGISVSSKNKQGFVGTLGFIAVDVNTQALVGVTNNHVVIIDAFYTTERNTLGVFENESSDNAYQPGEGSFLFSIWKIGEVVRYVPIYNTTSPKAFNNRVDGALISLTSTTVSNTESFKQFGLSGQLPMPFATTAEIDNLLTTNPPIYSTGRTSGAKEGTPCGLVIRSLGATVPVGGYKLQGNQTTAYFSDLIEFSRIDPTCPYPIYPGDSGSALIANFSGVWKIIGLCFAASDYSGFASRIDHVANELSIQHWDGSAKNFINPATKETLTLPETTDIKTVICSGQTYWQIGLTHIANPKC